MSNGQTSEDAASCLTTSVVTLTEMSQSNGTASSECGPSSHTNNTLKNHGVQLSRSESMCEGTSAEATVQRLSPWPERSKSVPGASSAIAPSHSAAPSRIPNFKIQLPASPGFSPSAELECHDKTPTVTAPNRAPFLSCLSYVLTPPDEITFQFENAPSQPNNTFSASSTPVGTREKSTGSEQPTSLTQPNELMPVSMTGQVTPLSENKASRETSWEETLVNSITSMNLARTPGNSIKVVSQAVPVPWTDESGNKSPTVFPTLIAALHQGSQHYVHIHHVLPLAGLTTSPPTTPSTISSSSSQEGYFDSGRIINSATYLADRYQPLAQGEARVSEPSTPSLAIPPSSAELSLYERFIPPSTSQEFLDLFEPNGSSPLVDRLTELTRSGTFVFLYPTKAGGTSFASEYLNPVLDPVLRSIMLSQGLSSDLGHRVSRMQAIPHLLPLTALRRRVSVLLSKLNESSSRNDGEHPKYVMADAFKAVVQISRKVWEFWWVQQETPRIRAVMLEYFRRGQSLPKDRHLSAAGLTRELIEAMGKRGYNPGEELGEGKGIEVGVFVIKRST